eukprot:TRINITY_DN44054_c0_g1_i1.p1 TRINITY_DN44054_c0_g1~~TRINITY_DN44054_c0_g1_i1.p1  ORF type:complete len:440 (-),score=52.82 TRINITY_DN44054_c0_g1_i1:47-1366(-)
MAPILLRRVASLVVGFLMCVTAGVVLSVGVWCGDLVDAAGWPSSLTATWKSLMDIGLYMSIDLGIFVDYVGRKGYDWPASVIAGLLLTSGWFVLSIAASGDGTFPEAVSSLAFFFIGHGLFAALAPQLRANSLNFGPQRSGLVDGFLLSGFGLSSSLFSFLYSQEFGGAHVGAFMAMLAIVSCGVSLASVAVTRRMPLVDSFEKTTGSAGLPNSDLDVVRATGISLPPFAVLRTLAFWRLWFIVAACGGAATFFVQSADHLVENVRVGDSSSVSKSLLVTIFSFSNVFGRLGGGGISDILHVRFSGSRSIRCGRILLAMASSAFMVLAAVLVLFSGKSGGVVIIATGLAGVSEGFLFACWIGTSRDLFGTEHFMTNMSMVNTGLAIGSATYFAMPGGLLGSLRLGAALCSLAALMTVSLSLFPRVPHPTSTLAIALSPR